MNHSTADIDPQQGMSNFSIAQLAKLLNVRIAGVPRDAKDVWLEGGDRMNTLNRGRKKWSPIGFNSTNHP